MPRFSTCYRGIEMTRHQEGVQRRDRRARVLLRRLLPWQREQLDINGLLRQYFPKKTDLSLINRDLLTRSVAELNRRPREAPGMAQSTRGL